ncbi:hypothetical protein F5Y09DRAFT_313259 [Xylaria sp. FL1042]|nr:hypothetical protein F5Y09DRAFT_313259 [Xylaria sp. FL1042]
MRRKLGVALKIIVSSPTGKVVSQHQKIKVNRQRRAWDFAHVIKYLPVIGSGRVKVTYLLGTPTILTYLRRTNDLAVYSCQAPGSVIIARGKRQASSISRQSRSKIAIVWGFNPIWAGWAVGLALAHVTAPPFCFYLTDLLLLDGCYCRCVRDILGMGWNVVYDIASDDMH